MPFKEKLLAEYKFKIEMHAHTSPISPCSQISPSEMVRIYGEKGYDAVVISNHFYPGLMGEKAKDEAIDKYISNVEEAKKEGEKYNIKVILGAEIRFSENHNDYLIYGVDREILSICYDYHEKGVEKFRKEIPLPKSLFIQAHPFRNGMEKVSPTLLDGIETFNMHPGHNSRVGQAVRYAKNNNMTITTAGSDFHHPDMDHEAVCALRTKILPEDSFQLARILKSKDYIFEIGESAIVLP